MQIKRRSTAKIKAARAQTSLRPPTRLYVPKVNTAIYVIPDDMFVEIRDFYNFLRSAAEFCEDEKPSVVSAPALLRCASAELLCCTLEDSKPPKR